MIHGVNLLTENLKQEFIYMFGMNVLNSIYRQFKWHFLFYSENKTKQFSIFVCALKKKTFDFFILIRGANYAQK